ncbi:phage holin family protein [Morganella psychrotolerans]|uniref:phage holin family protein n=1 Tax=Morganella psychrotolerans TaxID=368603 RepID=UPI0039AF61D2
MPNKFEWWEQILHWLQNALPFIGGFFMSATISYIRERREGSCRRQSLGESITCGLLSVGAIRLIAWQFTRSGDDESWVILAEFCGVMIGFLGTKKLYALFDGAVQIFKNRFGDKNK